MFKIVLVPGTDPQPFSQARAKRYRKAVVSEYDADDNFIRVVASNEYRTWGDTTPATKAAVSKEKPAPKKKTKKKANKPETAIPNESDSLENIDVSSI